MSNVTTRLEISDCYMVEFNLQQDMERRIDLIDMEHMTIVEAKQAAANAVREAISAR